MEQEGDKEVVSRLHTHQLHHFLELVGFFQNQCVHEYGQWQQQNQGIEKGTQNISNIEGNRGSNITHLCHCCGNERITGKGPGNQIVDIILHTRGNNLTAITERETTQRCTVLCLGQIVMLQRVNNRGCAW